MRKEEDKMRSGESKMVVVLKGKWFFWFMSVSP